VAQLLEPFAGSRAERTAQTLLTRFGTLDRALSASDAQIGAALDEDKDIGQLISAARALVIAGLQETVERTTVDAASIPFQTYLVAKFRGKAHEELHAIFVDQDLGFLSEDLVSIGGRSQVEARVSCILRRGLELGAAGFILIHNHPSQTPDPSVDDVRATKQTMTLSRSIGLQLIDHLIVAGNRVSSMRGMKLI
jgi:DNA repair protein RadC